MLFELTGVKKLYGGALALELPRLELARERFVAFYGPNGSGKTTLLSLLAGLDVPTEGTVRFEGGPRDVTLVDQHPYLFRATLLDNVTLGLRYRGAAKQHAAALAEPWLRRLGLWDLRHRGCAGLSAGERRRAALARGLVLGAKALLLDEPMSNLDRGFAATVEQLLAAEARLPGRTVIMATHDLGQAVRMGAEVVFLSGGRVSEVPLWNVFRCQLADDEGGGVKKAVVAPTAAFFVSTTATGPATISIDPRDILLSFQPVDSSALNCLRATVTAASLLGQEVDLALDVGCMLHAFITRRSFERMGLGPGSEVYATFKAAAVKLLE